MLNIDELIKNAMLAHKKDELETYKLIKAEFVKAEKDGVEMNDLNQAKILLKMVAQREDSISQYTNANRLDLAAQEALEKAIITELMPQQPTDEDIEEYTRSVITAWSATSSEPLQMRHMKSILTLVQEKYPTANGKIVSKVVQSLIKK